MSLLGRWSRHGAEGTSGAGQRLHCAAWLLGASGRLGRCAATAVWLSRLVVEVLGSAVLRLSTRQLAICADATGASVPCHPPAVDDPSLQRTRTWAAASAAGLCGFINRPAAGRRRDVWPRPGTSMAQRAHVSDAAAGMRAAHRLRRAQAPAGALAAGRTAPDSVRNHPISVRRHRPPLHRTRSARHGMLRIPRPRRIRQYRRHAGCAEGAECDSVPSAHPLRAFKLARVPVDSVLAILVPWSRDS
jgi:hypothetical protein